MSKHKRPTIDCTKLTQSLIDQIINLLSRHLINLQIHKLNKQKNHNNKRKKKQTSNLSKRASKHENKKQVTDKTSRKNNGLIESFITCDGFITDAIVLR